jgi:sec-independent protein translocase protein TatB
MFDFAWSELALIGVVALVVIGPKDLPRVMRTVGMWVRKARTIAREFQGSLEQMVREAEIDEVRQKVQEATRFDVEEQIKRHVDPDGVIHGAMKDPLAEPPPAAAEAPPLPPPAPEATLPPPAGAPQEHPPAGETAKAESGGR